MAHTYRGATTLTVIREAIELLNEIESMMPKVDETDARREISYDAYQAAENVLSAAQELRRRMVTR